MNPIKRAVEERLRGGRPSAVRALIAAGGAGVFVSGLVYRLLRR
jgi:hypothetical protein